MKPLRFSTGKRAVEEGNSLPQVAKGLTGDELAFWCDRMKQEGCYVLELAILEAEAAARSADYLAGPLFRIA
jgi:hypothetical protein